MFTSLTFGWFAMMSLSAAVQSEKSPKSCEFNALYAAIFTFGATPIGATVPFEVMMPVTFVPCPRSSCAAPGPLARFVPVTGHPPSA